MKKVLLIASITVMLLSHKSQAQTYSGHYKKMTTDHFKDNDRTASTTKFKGGELIISADQIKIDDEAYTILKRELPELQDEGYFAQRMIVVAKAKTGAYKVMDCIIELKPDKKTVDYVQLNKTKSTRVGYLLE